MKPGFAAEHAVDILDALDQGFCIIEVLFDETMRPTDYRFLEYNEAFTRQTGLHDALGQCIRDLVPAHEEHWFRIYGEIALTGVPKRFEDEAAALNRFYDVYAFRIGEPHLHRVAVFFTDITGRKRAEAALQASERRQGFLLKLSDAVRSFASAEQIKATATQVLGDHLGVDRVVYAEHVPSDTQGQWHIENVYHRAGYPLADGLYPFASFGRDSSDVLHGRTVVVNDVRDDPGISSAAQETFHALSVVAYAAVPLIKDDRFVAFMAVHQAAPREWQAEDLALLHETADRTWAAVERARVEKALQSSEQQLREADHRKDEFIAILSHELRNPLAPIQFAIPVLQRDTLSDSGKRAVAVIERQVRQLTRHVDDLLDVSRITSNRLALQREHVTLASVLTAAVEAASSGMAAALHTLSTDLPDDPIWLDVDPARAAQIITNLLNNSAKFTPRGGHIALTAACEDSQAVIRVRDNGVGIPEDQLQRIFEMFHQVTQPGRATGGLGIGLGLVQQLVLMHGGTIEARSAGLGQGAEFIVRLPLARESCAAGAPPVETVASGRPLRVLLVDDNVDLVDMLATVVSTLGHDVRKAFDGRSAVSAARAYRPDVVLLDLGLPLVDGLEVARMLRSDSELARMHLIALTGWGQSEDRRRTEEAGFDDHLTKPTDPRALEQLLVDLAARDRRAS